MPDPEMMHAGRVLKNKVHCIDSVVYRTGKVDQPAKVSLCR